VELTNGVVMLVISQLMNALALASLLTIVSSGLALIFGLRDVMNLSHGALYMLGAYVGYSVTNILGFWPALVIVPLALGLAGLALEHGVLRPLQRRSHIEVALITFGFALVLTQIIGKIWGKAPMRMDPPIALAGSVDLFGAHYPAYRLFLIAIGLGTCMALAAWLKWTRLGMYTRAASQQPEVAQMMGVNTDRLSQLVVCLGAAFAGLAGVLAGPYLSVDLGMGSAVLVMSLSIVVIGGLGSIWGAIGAAIAYAFVQVLGSVFFPWAALVVPYLLLIGVLVLRPRGFGQGRV
jgi:branched-chain amino acid transport system permease protein